jgi:hypothetical protein
MHDRHVSHLNAFSSATARRFGACKNAEACSTTHSQLASAQLRQAIMRFGGLANVFRDVEVASTETITADGVPSGSV